MNSVLKFSNLFRPAVIVAGFFVSSAILTGCFNRRAEIADRPVVKVNEITLSSKDFAERLVFRLKDFDVVSVKDPKILKRMKDQLADDFIVEALTINWARNQGIYVNSEDLEAEINSIRKQYPDDLTFRRALSEEGTTFAQWQEKLKYSLLQRKILNKIKTGLPQPTDVEVTTYYNAHKEEFQTPEQVHLRQIVLDSENNAKRIFDEVRHGRSIKELATKFSIAPEAEKGGDIGWIDRGTLEIFDSAFSMRIGQKSEVLKSPYGYHIFEVLDKKRASIDSLKGSENRIKRMLMEKTELNAYNAWLEKQVRAAKIYKDEELISSLSVETKDVK